MDSFYDQPRMAPISRTTPISAHQDLNLMPDASLLVNNHGIVPQNSNAMSYNVWKMHNKPFAVPTGNIFNKENIAAKPTNIITSQPSICRKQVRFESPQVLNTVPQNHAIMATSNVTRQDILNPKRGTLNPILQPKPFEKMYMANIPNRILDLSIIEPPVMNKCKIDVNLRENSHRNNQIESDFVKSVTNFQQHEFPRQQFKRLHSAESTTIEPKPVDRDEPTIKDLLKIIQQQNEQLMCLQKQVTTLLQERNDNVQRQIQPTYEPLNIMKSKPTDLKNGLPKFAIDVMTSFEVSIRPPNNFNNKKFNNAAKIHEIFEDKICSDERPSLENTCKTTDVSLRLDEPVVVQEDCPSPDNSIHVDMQDFSSESEDEERPPLLGWTIYNNVMDQVNCLLQKSQDEIDRSNPISTDKANAATMRKVKEATIRHLKNVGVNLPNLEDSFLSGDTSQPCNATEISYVVKQLLMKYLPDDQLAKLATISDKPMVNTKYTNLIKPRPEFSMATVQYMEKYNLLNKDPGTNQGTKKIAQKMLDITALKQQPKLL